MNDQSVALVAGTRPEVIKLAPLAKALLLRGVRPRLVLTGQHPQLRPADYGMPLLPMVELGCPGRPDPQLHVRDVARAIAPAIQDARLVVVQGDTSSALGGALRSAQAGTPVAHVEAGLRSHDRLNPWPEEDFRIAIDGLAALLFAPTELSAANLCREGAGGQVEVTGNTGIDALMERLPLLQARNSARHQRRLLVTCHRRESWGEGLQAIASCLRQIAGRGDASISFILHPNPRVAEDMRRLLVGVPNIQLRDPCSHMEMLQAMRESDLVLSDSGGMQEEAPTLGVPLLILRDRTERPEGIVSGNLKLVGRDPENIRAAVDALLDDPIALASMSRPSFPYGDGRASKRIAASIEAWLRRDEPRSPSCPSATAPAEPSKQFASRR